MLNDIDLVRSRRKTSKKLIMRHSFVRGLSSIYENSETTHVDENEMDKWNNRYQSALPDPAPRHSVEDIISPIDENPQFYQGKRPRYRLIHINWSFPKRLKHSRTKDEDVHAVSRGSTTTTNGHTTSTAAQSARKHRWTFSIKKKDSNQPISSSLNINRCYRRKGHAGDEEAGDLTTNKAFQKVLAQITAIKKKMKYKAAIIDQLSSEKLKQSSFKVGWRPYPSHGDFLGSEPIMLTTTWSQDSDDENA